MPNVKPNASVVYRKSSHDLMVIPGKLAIASATRNPGKSSLWIPVFAGMTVESTVDFFCDLWFEQRSG